MFVPRSTILQQEVAELAFALGLPDRVIARAVGLDRSTVCRWRHRGMPRLAAFDAKKASAWRPPSDRDYSYLLGLYLGDGCVVKLPRTYVLVIALDGLYPGARG